MDNIYTFLIFMNTSIDRYIYLYSCRRLFERLMADKRGRDHVGSIRVPDMDSMLDFRVEDEAEVYYEVCTHGICTLCCVVLVKEPVVHYN